MAEVRDDQTISDLQAKLKSTEAKLAQQASLSATRQNVASPQKEKTTDDDRQREV
jgi:hypothetical protein